MLPDRRYCLLDPDPSVHSRSQDRLSASRARPSGSQSIRSQMLSSCRIGRPFASRIVDSPPHGTRLTRLFLRGHEIDSLPRRHRASGTRLVRSHTCTFLPADRSTLRLTGLVVTRVFLRGHEIDSPPHKRRASALPSMRLTHPFVLTSTSPNPCAAGLRRHRRPIPVLGSRRVHEAVTYTELHVHCAALLRQPICLVHPTGVC
jgi:hypothetical protein